MIKWDVFWVWVRVLNEHHKLSSHPLLYNAAHSPQPRRPPHGHPPQPRFRLTRTILLTRRAPNLPMLATPKPDLGVIPSRRQHRGSTGHDDLRDATVELGPDACHVRVVPEADPPLKVAHAARGDERVCDDVQHAPLARRERDVVPLAPREEGYEDVRRRRRLLYGCVRALGACSDRRCRRWWRWMRWFKKCAVGGRDVEV